MIVYFTFQKKTTKEQKTSEADHKEQSTPTKKEMTQFLRIPIAKVQIEENEMSLDMPEIRGRVKK